jgi:hypothetical protein
LDGKFGFPSLVTVSTSKPPTDPLLHITALEGHFEITVSLNVHALNLKRFGERALQMDHNDNSLDQWYSTFFVRVPPDIISLQLCTPKVVRV